MNDKDVTVTLACGHLTTSNIDDLIAKHDDELQCWVCKHPRPWATFCAMSDGWSFQCTACRYKRAYGNAPFTCETKAITHGVRKHHAVRIYCDGVLVRTTATLDNVPLSGDTPPF